MQCDPSANYSSHKTPQELSGSEVTTKLEIMDLSSFNEKLSIMSLLLVEISIPTAPEGASLRRADGAVESRDVVMELFDVHNFRLLRARSAW